MKLGISHVQVQLLHLWSHNLVLVLVTFLLRVYDLLLFDPLAPCLLFIALPFLLLHCHQSSRLELILFWSQELRLYDSFSLVLRFRFESFLADCALEHSFYYSVLGYIPEGMIDDFILNDSSFLLRVIVRTGSFLTTFSLTFNSFIIWWVILLFFPSVAHVAIESYLTSAAVVWDRDVVFCFPVETWLHRWNSTIGWYG